MKRFARIIALVATLAGIPIALIGIFVTQPGCAHNVPSIATVDPALLRGHVQAVVSCHPRSYIHTDNLFRCAGYIGARLAAAGATVSTQRYTVLGRTYGNVIGRIGNFGSPLIVVGAHYDACGDTPGADDNASGVAGLLELADLVGQGGITGDVELVAYCTEEPPFFATPDMGSAHHARSLREANVDVKLAIALEMIGCFSDEKKSQKYPAAILHLFYPNTGSFIGVVGRPEDRAHIQLVRDMMRGTTDLDVRSASIPRGVSGVDFSDHRSYWDVGYPAIMVTDTAFFRNPDYHGEGDTADKLDYSRMSKVVVGVYEALKGISATSN
ncbi:MAG TPA: M28 family peptidase [Kiritimatiellia bacterium]